MKWKWKRDPWLIAIFGIIGTKAFDYFTGIPIIKYIAEGLSFLLKWLLVFLTFNIQIWWLLIAIGIILGGKYLIYKYGIFKPEFYHYRSDKFFVLQWEWSWKKIDGKWQVYNLHAKCPKCNTRLVPIENKLSDLICSRCAYSNVNDYEDEPRRISNLIYDNLTRKNYTFEQ